MATLKDAITNKVSKIQSDVQKTVNVLKDKLETSAEATKKGSTETPKISETPKVTSTPKATETTVASNPTVTISKTPTTYGPTIPATTSDVKNLFGETKTKSPISMVESSLFKRGAEDKAIVPTSVVNSADAQGGAVKETVDKTVFQQFSDWFNKPREDITKQTADLFVSHVDEEGIHLSKWLENLSMNSVNFINEAEFAIFKTIDVAANELGLYEPEEGLTKRFGNQFNYWENYGEERGEESLKKYESDTKAQDLKDRVSWEMLKLTEDEELSNTIGNVVGRVYSTASDPEEIAATVGYMLPGILATLASGGGFWAGTAVFAPSYATEAYQDLSKDKDITDNWGDTGVRSASAGIGILQAMVEEFGDAVGNMPWAKGFSKELRSIFTKNIKKDIVKGGEKIFMDEVEDIADNTIVKELRGGFKEILKNWFRGSVGEGVEEVVQDTILTEGAKSLGSKRDHMDLETALTDYFLGQIMGLEIMAPGVAVNFKKNQDLKEEYNKFSDNLDKVAPGINEETKQKFFSAMVTSQQNDANLSEKQISKYEEQTTKLYEERSMLEQRLNQADNDEVRAKINGMIEQTDNKIKEIDKKINQWNNTRDEINKYIEERNAKAEGEEEQKELEELHTEVNKQIQSQSEGGENLSNQTMREISEEKVEDVKIPNSPEGYVSLSEALKQPGNTYLSNLSDYQLKSLKRDVQDTWKYEGFFGYNNKSYRYLIKAINTELESRREKETISSTKKLTFKNAQDFVNKMIAIDKRNGDWSEGKVDKNLREKYFGWFLRNNIEGDFSAHLPGLKGINLKQIEKKLTDKNLRDIAEMIALVSKTFGIDFNKIINDSNISVNIVDNQNKFLYNTHNYGLMDWMPTKEQVMDLIKRTGNGNMGLAGDIIKMGVAITLDRGPEWSGSTMAHELMHLLDFAISTEEGLPLKYDNGTDYTSSIEGDYDWKTFKVGTYNPNYYNRWTEILARYAQQYYSWKNHPEVFKEYCKRDWYWSEQEFLKLVPKFEQFIKDRLGAKLLDEENQFYYDIVKKVNENKFKTISLEFDKEGLSTTDVKQKLDQIEEEYGFIMTHLDEMTGTLKEEMEAYVQLSNLQSNYEMAKAKGEEYLKMIKTTPEQQGTIDEVTTTVLPPEDLPQSPEEINNGIPQFGGSNIENGIGDIAEGGDGPQLGKSYMEEEAIIKTRERKNKIKNFRKELSQTWKDIITPAISRIYNISPRVAGRLITMETQKDINIYRYREKAKGFVETLGKLKGNNALEVKKALLDYGALASEQGENIEEYKKEEVAKLREVLLKNGFKEEDINDMFYVLDDIGQQYKDSGLDVNLSDMYFPRVVKDYEGLIDYMNRVSGNDIKVNKTSLLIRIKQIQQDPNLTEEQKEKKIRNVISMEFKQPGTTSQHGKERKIGKLSDWGEGIYAYYESPIESLDHYITTMVNAIQRQLFLGGLKEDANLEADIINQDTSESVSQIIGKLVEDGMINEEDVNELQKSILAVLNKKRSPKAVTAIKDITYIATITNFLSAINQLDDLGMTILKDKSGLKNIVKTIFGKANIKYDELGLEDAYEMFREEGGITNWLFKKSLFNFFDRIGKTSFINTAWESLIHQSQNEKTRKYLYDRLVSMYGQESADRMMEKIDSGNYMTDGQIDIEILRDLLYQLGSTQPLYTSAMPTTYLNHPWSRLCYALSSFTLKRIDWLVQGTREVYNKNGGGATGAVKAGAWLMGVSIFLAIFGAAVGDVGDLLKGKKEETFLWQLINNGIEEALKSGGSDALNSWLKIWDLSDYDIKLYKQQGLWGVISSKIKPFVFDLGKDITEAITEHNKDEITDLAKYVPIFGKLVYYWCFEDLGKETNKSKDKYSWGEEKKYDWGDNNKYDWGEKKEYNR